MWNICDRGWVVFGSEGVPITSTKYYFFFLSIRHIGTIKGLKERLWQWLSEELSKHWGCTKKRKKFLKDSVIWLRSLYSFLQSYQGIKDFKKKSLKLTFKRIYYYLFGTLNSTWNIISAEKNVCWVNCMLVNVWKPAWAEQGRASTDLHKKITA